ncbi:Mechanosensitive ion channel MscS [Corchorus olitorius]|uniref:Mechanosensitive ion channel protein n=1 Tax=Corchorus olitorius TaxID=93759 RepID=A0A1R3JAW2_9ROSI|nr:Mechanosensitive ion channel MscS [Corchorus olitorius]
MSKWNLKSFKSVDSSKDLKGNNDNNVRKNEELPILLDHNQQSGINMMEVSDLSDPAIAAAVILAAAAESTDNDSNNKHNNSNNNNNNNLNNESFRQTSSSSYDFWRDNNNKDSKKNGKKKWQAADQETSSPSKMSGHFFNKEISRNEIALDMDLDVVDDLKPDRRSATFSRDSRRVSFEDERYHERPSYDARRGSNASHDQIGIIHRSGLLSRVKSTKSRLIDNSKEEVQMMSGLLGRSGLLTRSPDLDDEDDPFDDQDVPDELRRANFNALTLIQWVSLILIVAALICSLLIPSLKKLSVWELKLWKWIQDTLFNQYVIETLSGPPLIEIQKAEEERASTAAVIQRFQNAGATVPPDLQEAAFPPPKSAGKLQKAITRLKTQKFSQSPSRKEDKDNGNNIPIEKLHKLNPKNISAWNMKRLVKMVRHGTLSTLDEQIMFEPTESDPVRQIRNEYEATAAAKKIFHNVAQRGSKFIYLEDLMRFMREDEALRTMIIFEGGSEKSRISKSSLKNWVVNAYRERRALALTLNDTKTAVNKLHQIVNVIVAIIITIIWLVILDIATSSFVAFFTSQVVLAAFIFGNTCKTIFESIIFLFIIHPFDVGDRCEIDGVQMVVEEMNILTTVFLRYDNMKLVFPNSYLSQKPIGNFYRSPDMGDAIDFSVHMATPVEKIALMKQKIISYIESRKEHWASSPMIILKEIDEMNRMKMAVWLTHRMNYQDVGERWVRRAKLAEEMVNVFKELDMQYRLHPIDINVCSMPPVNSTRNPWAENSA